MCCFGGLRVSSLGSSIDGWSMQDWDDLPLTSKVVVLWCAKDGSVVLKAHRSCVSSGPGLRAPLNDYLAFSLDSEWWLLSCFCFPISVLCSVSMQWMRFLMCFFFPFFRSRYFVFIDSLSLKLVDVLVLEERCKVIILDSIMDSRFASLQQVLLASFLYFNLFSCLNAGFLWTA